MSTATFVVAPNYMAQITGIQAVRISARKVALINRKNEPFCDVRHSQKDGIGEKDFLALTEWVLEKYARENRLHHPLFRRVVMGLLHKHYGLEPGDVDDIDMQIVEALAHGTGPAQFVQDIAQKRDLERIDLNAAFTRRPIGDAEESEMVRKTLLEQ